ncbi:hypothetical protein C0Q70_09075, partial [Pomacea canaliculata]
MGESCLDHELSKKMASLIEDLTTSGNPSLNLDKMKGLKKICRSHAFRELLVSDFQNFLELTVETDHNQPLPPPRSAAVKLRSDTLKAIQQWQDKFGAAYKKLSLGYNYLKSCKHVDFSDIRARSQAERRRNELQQEQKQKALAAKLDKVQKEIAGAAATASKHKSTSSSWSLSERNGAWSSNDPTSRAANLAKLGLKDDRAGKTLSSKEKPSCTITSGESSNIPELPFGPDLAYWGRSDKIEAPTVVKNESLHRFWAPAQVEAEKPSQMEMAAIMNRTFHFVGNFVPVKWKCRVMLPSGKLCERMDRVKCPFHGKIIARDENGEPSNPEDVKVEVPETSMNNSSEIPPWLDAELQADIEAATGHDLGSERSKIKQKKKGIKGKAKGKKYPGLTDIKETNNTTRSRLEAKVFNRSALKRVASRLDAADYKRLRDKFANQFNYAHKNRLSTLAKKSTFLQKEIKKETTLQRSHEVVADAKLLKEKSPKPSEQTEDGTEVIPVEPPPDLFKDLRYDEALAIRKIPTLHVWDPVVSVLVKHHLAYQPPVEVPKPFTLGLQLPVDEKKQPLELYKPFSRFTRGKVETLKVQQPWCQNATLRRQLSKQEHALQAWENSLESSARKTAWISKEIGRPAGKLLLSIPLHLPPTENHRGMSHGPEHDFPKLKHQERFYHSDAFFWMPRRVGSAEFAIDSTPTWTERKFYKPPLTIARPHLDDMLPTSLRNERRYQDQERVREHLEKIAVKGAAVQLHWPSSVVLSPHDDYGKRKFLRRLTFLHRVPSDPVHSKACLMVAGKMYYWGEPCPQDLVEVGFVCRTGERADNEIRLANMGSTVIR